MKLKNLFFPILALIILTFFILNLQNFKLDASSDTLILQNDKDFKFFNYYNDVFKSKNFLVLAIKYQKIIDRNYIQKINEIKNKLLEIEEIESIFSIVDAPILLSNNINLSNLKNNIETINNTQINLEIILEEFIESPLYSNQIISKDKKLSAMIIYLKKDLDFNDIKTKRNNYLLNKEIDNKELNKINQKYKKLKEVNNIKRNKLIYKIRNDLNTLIKNDNESINDYSYFLGGIDMIIDDTITFIKKDILTFAIAVFIFIFFILFLIFRNLKWVFIPIISTSYAIISMIGLIGFLKWEVTAISSNFISLMLILSISMCVHIINNYRFNYNNKIVNPINTTMYKMFWPCFYTALTTIVAFSSLLFSDIKPVIDFGKIMIIALSIIFITSFTILPLLISFFPKIENKQNIKFRILDLFYNYAVNNSIKIYSINII